MVTRMGRIFRGYSWMIFWAATLRSIAPIDQTREPYDIFHLLLWFFISFIIYYVSALIPMSIAIVVSEFFSIRSKISYFAANFAISLSLTMLLFTSFRNGLSFSRSNYLNYGYLDTILPLVCIGTLPALAYWYVAGQFAGSSDGEYRRRRAIQDARLP